MKLKEVEIVRTISVGCIWRHYWLLWPLAPAAYISDRILGLGIVRFSVELELRRLHFGVIHDGLCTETPARVLCQTSKVRRCEKCSFSSSSKDNRRIARARELPPVLGDDNAVICGFDAAIRNVVIYCFISARDVSVFV
jgi:hypothetical protein